MQLVLHYLLAFNYKQIFEVNDQKNSIKFIIYNFLILELLSAPNNLNAVNISSKSVTLTWQVCKDNLIFKDNHCQLE